MRDATSNISTIFIRQVSALCVQELAHIYMQAALQCRVRVSGRTAAGGCESENDSDTFFQANVSQSYMLLRWMPVHG